MRAADHAPRGKNQKRGRRRLDQALQAIPIALRNFAQFRHRIQDKIENHERKIAVAQKQIRRLHRFGRFPAAHPKQMPQRASIDSDGLRIERIATVDQGDEITIAGGTLQKSGNERCTARISRRAGQFGDRAFR